MHLQRLHSILWTVIEKRLIQVGARLHLYSYPKWLRSFDEPAILCKVSKPNKIEKTIVFFVRPTNEQALKYTIESLYRQSCPNWICVLPNQCDQKVDEHIIMVNFGVETFSTTTDLRYLVKQIIASTSGDYLVILRAGDRLHPHYCLLLQQISADIIYTDQDLISERESRHTPFLKPDWSPILWTNVDILYGAAIAVRMLNEVLKEETSSYDLVAECVIRSSCITHLPHVLLHTPTFPWESDTLRDQHKKRITDYLRLRGFVDVSMLVRPNGSLKPKWNFSPDRVSIIIPTRDHAKILKRCVESIVKLTDYPDYEIIVVDSQSIEEETFMLYQALTRECKRIKIISTPMPFNFSQACNNGANHASGLYLLFLNNDIEITHPDWLIELVQFASVPCVGAVGAKLLYPGGSIQHAGIVIGMQGHAHHVFMGYKTDQFTPHGFIDWQREVSAVTGACLMVPRKVYWEIGGFDESYTLVFGDINLCLRLLDHGYKIILNPDSKMIHYEGSSRGKYIPITDLLNSLPYFMEKISKNGDPFYHLGLSRSWHSPTLRQTWEQSDIDRFRAMITLDLLIKNKKIGKSILTSLRSFFQN